MFTDDKRLQSFNKETSYPYETNVEKACQEELLLITETDFNTLKQRIKCLS